MPIRVHDAELYRDNMKNFPNIEVFLKNLTKQIQNSALAIDSMGQVLFCNSSCESLFTNIDRDVVIFKIRDMIKRADSDCSMLEETLPLRATDSSLDLAVTLHRIHGEVDIWVALLAHDTPVQEEDQTRKHIEKMASVGEMSAAIVHEIRNPLTIITGQVSLAQEYIKRGSMDLEKSQRLVDRLQKSCNRINSIIKSLLNLARNTEHDQKEIHSLQEIIEEVELFASMKVRGSKVPLQIESLEQDIFLLCYPSEVIQVLNNLIKNAKEEIYQQENPWVKVSFELENSKVRINVTDSGNGIPEEIVEKIWSPFYTTKAVGEGTGIGLSLCKKLIEEVHEGRLYLDKEHEHTRFVIELERYTSNETSKGA